MDENQQREEEEEQERQPQQDEDDSPAPAALQPSFPLGRVKRIVKLDRDINKLNSEALLLISLSADLFLGFLAERARRVAVEKKKKVIRVEHLRSAALDHGPTSDFLLDCLPSPMQVSDRPAKAAPPQPAPQEKPLPPGAQRIDAFFRKTAATVVDPE